MTTIVKMPKWAANKIKVSDLIDNPRLAETVLDNVPQAEYIEPILLPFPKTPATNPPPKRAA